MLGLPSVTIVLMSSGCLIAATQRVSFADQPAGDIFYSLKSGQKNRLETDY
jgi:hypothetical protein